jgi:hypothetical protein
MTPKHRALLERMARERAERWRGTPFAHFWHW